MHDYLARVLEETPDPASQRQREAEKSLEYWKERTRGIFKPESHAGRSAPMRRLGVVFAMPIPLLETWRLWRFANDGDSKWMLRRNLVGAAARLTLTVPIITYISWTYSDRYQIRRILQDAPVAQAASSAKRLGQRDTINDWAEALVYSDRIHEAFEIIPYLRDSDKPYLMIRLSDALAGRGKTEEAKKALDQGLTFAKEMQAGEDYRLMVLTHLAAGFDRRGRTDEADKIYADCRDALRARDPKQCMYCDTVFENVAERLIQNGKTIDVISDARQINDDQAWVALARAFRRAKQFNDALDAISNVKQKNIYSFELTNIIKELIRAGNVEQALSVATDVNDQGSLDLIRLELADYQTENGKLEAAFETAHQIGSGSADEQDQDYIFSLRSTALAQLAGALFRKNRLAESNRVLDEALNLLRQIKDREVRLSGIGGIQILLVALERSEEAEKAADEYIAGLSQLQRNSSQEDQGDSSALFAAFVILVHPTMNEESAEAFVESSKKRLEEVLVSINRVEDRDTRTQFLIALGNYLAVFSTAKDLSNSKARASREGHPSEENGTDADEAAIVSSGLASLANRTLTEALSGSSQIVNDEDRSRALSRIAIGFTVLRSFRKARLTSETCSSVDKLAVYTAILNHYTGRTRMLESDVLPMFETRTLIDK
jgi:tetratricopeptide (TPR) repeat protein